MSKPRVLVLTSTFPAGFGDGTPQFVLDLCAALSRDYEITVVTPRVPGARKRETISGVEVWRFAYFPRRFEGLADGATLPNLRAQRWRVVELPFLLLKFHLSARSAISRTQPDLIHAHWLLPCGLHALWQPGRGGTPVVVTVHGVDMHALRVRPLEAVRRSIIRRAATVVAVSSDLANRVTSLVPAASVAVVPMGADVNQVVGAVGTRLPESGHIGFVGRLAEKKGVGVLLSALSRTEDLVLTVAGDGPDREQLEQTAGRLGVEDRVNFIGQADRASVFELLRAIEMLVLPSIVAGDGDQEGTPVVLAEAVAAGVPVVASRLGGLGEQLDDDSAWLVEPNDPDALGRALVDAHGSAEKRAARAAHARRVVSPRLSLDATVAAYRAIYEGLLK